MGELSDCKGPALSRSEKDICISGAGPEMGVSCCDNRPGRCSVCLNLERKGRVTEKEIR